MTQVSLLGRRLGTGDKKKEKKLYHTLILIDEQWIFVVITVC